MRSKSRIRPNAAILQSELSRLAIKDVRHQRCPGPLVPSTSVRPSIAPIAAPKVIELQTKVKRGRGLPPKSLINTKKLLTS